MENKVLLAILALLLSSCSPALAYSEKLPGIPEVMIQTVAMESANQPFEGQTAVARVIINRSNIYCKSFEDVCLAPKQFSCWNSQKWADRWLESYYTEKARKSAKKAIEMAFKHPSNNKFTHYHAIGCYPQWAVGRSGVRIGDHVFYGGIQ